MLTDAFFTVEPVLAPTLSRPIVTESSRAEASAKSIFVFFPPSSSEIFIATPVAGKSRKLIGAFVSSRFQVVTPSVFLALKVRALLPSLWRVIVSISARASAEEKPAKFPDILTVSISLPPLPSMTVSGTREDVRWLFVTSPIKLSFPSVPVYSSLPASSVMSLYSVGPVGPHGLKLPPLTCSSVGTAITSEAASGFSGWFMIGLMPRLWKTAMMSSFVQSSFPS